jgi:hypothetical protein
MATVILDRYEAERSDLPRVCMYCGRHATQAVRQKFRWYPPFVISPLLRMFLTKTMYVGMPVCDSHAGGKLWTGPSLWGLRPTHISGTTITLSGVSEEFADALDYYRLGQDPLALSDEERAERRQRRVREDEARAARGGSGGSAWPWLLVGGIVLVPVLLCGGFALLLAVLPSRPANTSLFVFPTLPAVGQVPPREARPEELGMVAVAPDASGIGCLPWPALAFNLRKEPIVLISDADLDKALADLTAPNGFTVRGAANRLAKVYPAEARRAEVARALEPLATNRDASVRQAGAHALAVWATPDSVPTLIKLLSDPHPGCRAEAMNALAALKDERGAALVVQRLTDFADRGHARQALEAMGPIAEKPVLALLANPDGQTRVEACNVLKTIGTLESVAELEKAVLRDKDPRVKRAAQDALKAIQARF